MEEINMYAIYDRESKKYETPFFTFNDVFAGRRFIMLQDDQDNPGMLSKFSESFELRRIGTFNVITGEIKPTEPEKIMDGKKQDKGDKS